MWCYCLKDVKKIEILSYDLITERRKEVLSFALVSIKINCLVPCKSYDLLGSVMPLVIVKYNFVRICKKIPFLLTILVHGCLIDWNSDRNSWRTQNINCWWCALCYKVLILPLKPLINVIYMVIRASFCQ